MAKKFITMDYTTGRKQLSDAIVDKEYLGDKKDEVSYSVNAIDDLLNSVDGDITLDADFKVTGVTVGNFTDGKVIPAGTSVMELLQQMLQKQIAPTYKKCTSSLSGSSSGNHEVGTLITPTITAAYTKNDAGEVNQYTLKKNNVEVLSESAMKSYVEPQAITISEGKCVYYKATLGYSDGPIKNDNFGKPYPSTSIKAGSVETNEVSYNGYRKYFWGADANVSKELVSDDVRGLSKKSTSAATSGSNFSITIPAGCQRAVFAYPATVRDVTSVKYVELGNGEVKDTFTKYLVDVEGANNYQSIQYKVYVYVAATPVGATMTYNVTI